MCTNSSDFFKKTVLTCAVMLVLCRKVTSTSILDYCDKTRHKITAQLCQPAVKLNSGDQPPIDSIECNEFGVEQLLCWYSLLVG